MLNQAVELREGDTLIGVGAVIEVVRRAHWVRITAQPEQGTPVCFDLPTAIVVETDRPTPTRVKQDLPWTQPKGPNPTPKIKVNPTPIPVTLDRTKPSTSAPSSPIGDSTAVPHTLGQGL